MAKERNKCDAVATEGRKTLNGDGDEWPCRQRDLLIVAAMVLDLDSVEENSRSAGVER